MDRNKLLVVLSSFVRYFSILITSGVLMVLSFASLFSDPSTIARLAFMTAHLTAGTAAAISTFSLLFYGRDVCNSCTAAHYYINTGLYNRFCILSGLLLCLSFISYFIAMANLFGKDDAMQAVTALVTLGISSKIVYMLT